MASSYLISKTLSDELSLISEIEPEDLSAVATKLAGVERPIIAASDLLALISDTLSSKDAARRPLNN